MKRSVDINEIAAAMAKAQPAFEAAGREHKARVETKTGGSYEFNYADFAAYLDVCRKPLGEHGLSFTQEAVTIPGEVSVTTLLMHSSGQWIETEPLTIPLIADSRGAVTAQIIGSGITYAKRYSLSSLIGLASESDDDGNQASGNKAETGKREAPPACPACEKTSSVIRGKPEFGGGWVCWKNREGCGHTWQSEKPADKPNPNGTGKTVFQNGIDLLERMTASKAAMYFDWVKAQKIAKHLTAEQYAELDQRGARVAVEVCQEDADFEAVDKVLIRLIGEMRLEDAFGSDLRIQLADAKDAAVSV